MMKHRLKFIYYMCVNECECSMIVCMHVFACVCVYKWVNMHLCALYVDAQGRCKESTIILSRYSLSCGRSQTRTTHIVDLVTQFV